MKCKCGSREIENDSARGVSVCLSCGNVVESQAIVSELSFANSMANGYFLNQNNGQAAIFAGSKYHID